MKKGAARNAMVCITCLVLLIALFSTVPSASAATAEDTISIEGVVEAVEVGDDGKPSIIVINTEDGEYEVMQGGKFPDLAGLIGAKVVATGTVKEEEGFRFILVDEFTVEEQ